MEEKNKRIIFHIDVNLRRFISILSIVLMKRGEGSL